MGATPSMGHAVAVHITADGGHVGLVYAEGPLGWWYLSQQPAAPLDATRFDPNNSGRLVVCGLEPALQRQVAVEASAVVMAWESEASLPYGFDMDVYFDDLRQVVCPSPGGGVSCATLVSAVFARAGVPLIHAEGWAEADAQRVREDVAQQDDVLRQISGASPALAAHLRARGLGAFLRPVEAAGASGLPAGRHGLLEVAAAGDAVRVALGLGAAAR
jgi:hypothetical protein